MPSVPTLKLVEEIMTYCTMQCIKLFCGPRDCGLRTIAVRRLMHSKPLLQMSSWTCSIIVLFRAIVVTIVFVATSKYYASFPFVRKRISEE
jgi:hypothetical protein